MGAEPIEATITLDWTAGSARTQLPGSPGPPDRVHHTRATGGGHCVSRVCPCRGGFREREATPSSPDGDRPGCAGSCLEVKNAPARGIDILRPVSKGEPKHEANISAKQAESGFNLAGLAVMRAGQELRNLLNAIRLKHTYLQTAWQRLDLVPPPEPELVEAQRQLATAWTNYAIGYEKIIRRLPKTVDIELILAEAVEAKPLPVAQRPAQNKPTQETAPATAPASQPTTRPASRPATQPASGPASAPGPNPIGNDDTDARPGRNPPLPVAPQPRRPVPVRRPASPHRAVNPHRPVRAPPLPRPPRRATDEAESEKRAFFQVLCHNDPPAGATDRNVSPLT